MGSDSCSGVFCVDGACGGGGGGTSFWGGGGGDVFEIFSLTSGAGIILGANCGIGTGAGKLEVTFNKTKNVFSCLINIQSNCICRVRGDFLVLRQKILKD